MTKPSVISIVPIELFTEDNFTEVKKAFKKYFDNTKKASNEQAKEICEVIKSNFDFSGDNFKINPLNTPGTELHIKQPLLDVKVTQKIFLATQGTSFVFVAIYELKDIPSDEKKLFETMKDIRESLNDLIKKDYYNLIRNLRSEAKGKSQQNSEKNKAEDNKEPKDLVSYIKRIEDFCIRKLWEFTCPSYAFTFFYLFGLDKNFCGNKQAKSEEDSPSNKMLERAKKLTATQEEEGQNIKFANKYVVHVNWSTFCMVVSDKVDKKERNYINDVIALQIVLQMLWNRSNCFSNLIHKMVKLNLNTKSLGIKNLRKLHLEFLTAIANIEFIAYTTVSARILKLLKPFIKTSRINKISSKLKNYLEMFNKRVLERVEEKYKNLIQGILIAFTVFTTVFTVVSTVFNLRWIDLDSWQLATTLSILMIILFFMVRWAVKYSKSVEKIQKL